MTYSNGPLHSDVQVKDDQLELIYNSSIRTLDVAWKTCRKPSMIEMYVERELGKSMPAARHKEDDDDMIYKGIICR